MKTNTNITIWSRLSLIMLVFASCLAEDSFSESTRLILSTEEPSTQGVHNTPIPTVVDPGLAYGDPCYPPCWRNLTPGLSTIEDTQEMIEQLHADEWAVTIEGNASSGYHIYPASLTSLGSIHINFTEGLVTQISGTTLFYYPAASMVAQFGSPEWLYLVDKGSTICTSCEPPVTLDLFNEHPTSIPVNFLYPTQGLWFQALLPIDEWGCICSAIKVTAFCYYIPTSVEEALESDCLVSAYPNLTEEDLTEWHGFGGGY